MSCLRFRPNGKIFCKRNIQKVSLFISFLFISPPLTGGETFSMPMAEKDIVEPRGQEGKCWLAAETLRVRAWGISDRCLRILYWRHGKACPTYCILHVSQLMTYMTLLLLQLMYCNMSYVLPLEREVTTFFFHHCATDTNFVATAE